MTMDIQLSGKRPNAIDVKDRDRSKWFERWANPMKVALYETLGYEIWPAPKDRKKEKAPTAVFGGKDENGMIKNADGQILMRIPIKLKRELERQREVRNKRLESAHAKKALAENPDAYVLDEQREAWERDRQIQGARVSLQKPEMPASFEPATKETVSREALKKSRK